MLISGCGSTSKPTEATNNTTTPTSATTTKEDDVTTPLYCIWGGTASIDLGKITNIEISENGDTYIYYTVEEKIYSPINGKDKPTYTNQGDNVCIPLKDCNINTKFSSYDATEKNQIYVPEIGDSILFGYGNDSALDKYVEKKDRIVKLYPSDPDQLTQQSLSIYPLEYSGLVTGEITSITDDNKLNIKVTKERDVFTKDSQLTVEYLWASSKTASETVRSVVDFTDYLVFNPEFTYPDFESTDLKVGDTICFKYGKQDAMDYKNSPEDYVFKPLVVTLAN